MEGERRKEEGRWEMIVRRGRGLETAKSMKLRLTLMRCTMRAIAFAILFLSVLSFGFGQEYKYGKIVNVEPGVAHVSDIVLGAKLGFDPLNVREVSFKAPTFDHPYFHLIVPVRDWSGNTPSISKFKINGEDPETYWVFVGGELRVHNWLAIGAKSVKDIVILAKYAWHNSSKYNIEIELSAPRAVNMRASEDYVVQSTVHDVASPASGGIPIDWKYAQVLVLSEESGLPREHEPVDLAVCVRRDRVRDLEREMRVMEYDPGRSLYTEVPSQVFNVHTYSGRRFEEKGGVLDIPSVYARVLFFAEIPKNSKKIYTILYGNSRAGKPSYASDLTVEGEGLGSFVENEHYLVELEKKSGQVNSIKMKKTRGQQVPLLSNSTSGSVHWNPDTYGENGAWGHAFSWDPPEKIITIKGPLMYRITRCGRMPGNPEMFVSVTYTFYAGLPYYKMSSVMEVNDPYAACAIRNGEMVFDGDLFDHYAWKAGNGERRVLRTLMNPDQGIDAPAVIPNNTPWLCLYNSQNRYAMGSVQLEVYDFSKYDGTPATYRPGYFLYCHPQWARPLTYFVRTHVYSWGYNWRGPIPYIPEGNCYVEENVFFPFILGSGDPFEPIEDLNLQLRHPLELSWGM